MGLARDRAPVIVGWDGSEHAKDALDLGCVIAAALRTGVVASEVAVDRLAALRRHRGASERPMTPPAVAGAVPVEARPVVNSSAGHGLHDLAEELGAAAIVIGATDRGPAGRVFLGSVADDLVHGAPCPVAIAPRGYAKRYANRLIRVVVVAFDASPESELAAEHAGRIAHGASGSLQVLAVLEPPPLAAVTPGVAHDIGELMRDAEATLRREVAALVAKLPPEVRPAGHVVRGDPVEAITREAEDGVDLLVLGSRGYGPVGRALLGSVSSAIARSAPCPVMVVPRSPKPR